MSFEQGFYQTKDYEMKVNKGNIVSYNEMSFRTNITEQYKNKVDEFKERLAGFRNIATLEDAKAYAKRIMPVSSERTVFKVGDAKCTIINKDDVFRVTLSTPDEFITYNFS